MKTCGNLFRGILCSRMPGACAQIAGIASVPDLRGWVRFWPVRGGILAEISLFGLPGDERRIFGMHIHAGESCTGTSKDPLADTKGHYDKDNHAHPFHSGDLPPVFAWQGQAWSCVFIGGVTLREILGRTVVVHAMPDDLKTQPSGGSGEKIACGVIHSTGKGNARR